MGTNFGPTIEQRLNPSIERHHSLADALLQSLRVALPGSVLSFSPGPPATVSVVIATDELVTRGTSENDPSLFTKAMQLPILEDVPILIPSAGRWSFTFPIEAGDECLVVFADTALDVWLQNGKTHNQPISQRRHSLSDGIAIFGLRSKPRGLENYSTSSAQIRNDDATVVIDLTDAQVHVKAPSARVECTGKVEVDADTVEIAATSTVKIGANTTIDGKVFLNHKHTGVSSGFSQTGTVA